MAVSPLIVGKKTLKRARIHITNTWNLKIKLLSETNLPFGRFEVNIHKEGANVGGKFL